MSAYAYCCDMLPVVTGQPHQPEADIVQSNACMHACDGHYNCFGLLTFHFLMHVAPAAVACGDSCPLARADHDGDGAGELKPATASG